MASQGELHTLALELDRLVGAESDNGNCTSAVVDHRVQPRRRRKALAGVAIASVACLVLIAGLRFSLLEHRVRGRPDPRVEMKWDAPSTTDTTATTVPPGSSPTLFCWSHIQDGTNELALIRLQLVKRASIFACNYAAVIGTTKLLVGNVDGSDVWTWVNPAAEVSLGRNGVDGATTDSFLNTQTFLHAWDTLLSSKLMWPFDFVVKVDPDAVFFPDRLRGHVEPHLGQPVYFSNCAKYGGQVLLYGSLEVFSIPAMRIYEERLKDCKQLPYHGWGEDYFMQHCMDQLGIANIPDEQQVADERCVGAPCSDFTKAAFHDFKDPESWYACFREASGQP